jgi:hypothetical protein
MNMLWLGMKTKISKRVRRTLRVWREMRQASNLYDRAEVLFEELANHLTPRQWKEFEVRKFRP